MKKILIGVLIGFILGLMIPVISARVNYKYKTYLSGMNRIVVLLEEITDYHRKNMHP